jgi:hypothetical protein
MESRCLSIIAPENTERFYLLLTEADERLLEAGKWAWTRGPIDLIPVNGVVTLPLGYESIVGCRIGSMAAGVLWQEIEYVEGGPGVIPVEGCQGQLLDQGMVGEDRVYKCVGAQPDVVVVLARYAPRELTKPEDVPRCQSFSALRSMMMGIIYEEKNDLDRAQGYFQMAMATLNNQETAYRGSAKKIFDPKIYGPPRRTTHHNFP